MLTDGIQTKNKGFYTPLFFASQPLKDKGVNIFSLGIGSDLSVMEQLQVASSHDNVFYAMDFNYLSRKVTEITKAMCVGTYLLNSRLTCE